MAVSLRIVIGVLTAVIVLIVAATTLAITYTVSVDAVRDAGERLSESIATGVSQEVHAYFAELETDLFVFKNWSKVEGFALPPDRQHFSATTEEWGEPIMDTMRVMNFQTSYKYSSVTVIFNDGSLCAGLGIVGTNVYGEGCFTWRRFPNGTEGYGTVTQRAFDRVTKVPWDVATRGPQPPVFGPPTNMTRSAYAQIVALTGGREVCMYSPPGVDTSVESDPRFVLYGLCTLFNRTGARIGQISIGRFLDVLPSFLQGTSKTLNTQLVLVDSFNLLLGSSLPGEQPVSFHRPGTFRYHSGCTTSEGLNGVDDAIQWGCRITAADYDYAPLQDALAADATLTRQPGRVIKFGKLAGENYYYISQRIPTALTGYFVNLLLFMPEQDVLGDIVAGRNLAIGVTVAVFVVAAAASFVLIGLLLAPVDDVARRMYLTSKLSSAREAAYRAEEGRPLNAGESDGFSTLKELEEDDAGDVPLAASSMAEVRALQMAYTTMDTAIKSFTKYVPRDVVKELMLTNQMCEISMRPMRCSMLFTDIAGFTSICERVPPHILSALVRVYFERMSSLVMGHGGMIDKFIGDCIMAVWGAPVAIDHHELRAAVCARMLTHETGVDPLRGDFAKAGEELAIRVGVATGEVLAGNMGSRARMNYTVIGDDVNLASRLEGLNKQWGTSVMVSEETADSCNDYLAMRYVISIAVVGKTAPVKVFEVLGVLPDADTEALGKVTSEASEQQTLAQAKRDAADEELARRYGYADGAASANTGAGLVKSTGWLLRYCRRKVPVAAEEVAFARAYAAAIAQWDRGDVAGCAAALRAITEEAGGTLPADVGQRLSVRRVLEAAEDHLRNGGVPAGWTGVWVANEK